MRTVLNSLERFDLDPDLVRRMRMEPGGNVEETRERRHEAGHLVGFQFARENLREKRRPDA